ncbi:hypothetical protein CC78DRAFT_268297 [Lojkania enalia]|uniref:Uncharacterized protein n=1 Tax=Lojkania enalia TaxID=147567 RepID=A0A9P4K8B3_9PLEO|nr:hypothetical protein CC78DRAFT_268297 [Didymosphaeria enalia]
MPVSRVDHKSTAGIWIDFQPPGRSPAPRVPVYNTLECFGRSKLRQSILSARGCQCSASRWCWHRVVCCEPSLPEPFAAYGQPNSTSRGHREALHDTMALKSRPRQRKTLPPSVRHQTGGLRRRCLPSNTKTTAHRVSTPQSKAGWQGRRSQRHIIMLQGTSLMW